MKQQFARSLHLQRATGTIRTAMFDGRNHIVVPVVALVEGVIHPINSETPELVLAEEFAIAPEGWNGRPIFCGHPTKNGTQVPGNTPAILETLQIGQIFNAHIDKNRLCMEAWVDPELVEKVGGDAIRTLERINADEMIEISTGVLVVTEKKSGIFSGKRYAGVWRNIVPDHLALLPEGDLGACSISMGCGTPRAAMVHCLTAEGVEFVTNQKSKTKESAQSQVRKKLLGLVKSLVGTPQEEAAEEAAELVQYTTIEQMLDAAETTTTQAQAIVAQLIADETEDPTEGSAEEEAEETVEHARLEALYALAGSSIDSLYKVLSLTSQCLMDDNDDEYPRYAKGARNNKLDQKVIQSVHDNSAKLGATCEGMKAAQSSDCGCGNKNKGELMDRKERISALMANKHNPVKEQKALEALTDEGLKSLETLCTKETEAEKLVEKAATDKAAAEKLEAETKAAAAKKPQTEEEYLATAPSSIKQIIASHKATVAARKTELVGKLKTAVEGTYTEEELKGMELDQLERLAKVAKVGTAASVVDFSGRGISRPEAAPESDEAPAPPSLFNALMARDGKPVDEKKTA